MAERDPSDQHERMMERTPAEDAQLETRGVHHIGTAAALGLAAGILAVVVPIAFLLLTSYAPGGFFTFNTLFVQATTILVLVGAILFLLSLFFYRRGFGVLRKVDGRYTAASILCIIGSIGFLLLIIAAALLLGSSNSLLQCLHGQPSHALSCLRSTSVFGEYTALIGFWLGWIGGLGIVMGVFLTGGRYHRGALYGGGVLYAILLLLLIGPFLDLLAPIGEVRYLLLLAPVMTVLAPGLVLAGARSVPVASTSS
jgi:hypothetical protein